MCITILILKNIERSSYFMSEILDQLKTRHIKKRGGEVTSFYGYKIDWVLHQLELTNKEVDDIKNSIVNACLPLDDPIPAAKLFDIIKQLLSDTNLESANKYQRYHDQEIEDFKHATDPSYKLNQYFSGDKNIINENANKDHRIYNTQRDLIAGTVSRAVGLKMLPDIVAKAHQRGDIHWHDLDYSPVLPETNCSLPDFKDMLAHGFKIGNANVSSPKSIETAVALVVQVIGEIGGLQYGYIEAAVL